MGRLVRRALWSADSLSKAWEGSWEGGMREVTSRAESDAGESWQGQRAVTVERAQGRARPARPGDRSIICATFAVGAVVLHEALYSLCSRTVHTTHALRCCQAPVVGLGRFSYSLSAPFTVLRPVIRVPSSEGFGRKKSDFAA